jgi:hypothetical protein
VGRRKLDALSKKNSRARRELRERRSEKRSSAALNASVRYRERSESYADGNKRRVYLAGTAKSLSLTCRS